MDSIGGYDRVQAGDYFAKIVKVDEESDQKGKMIVDFEILSGTNPGQESKVLRLYFEKSNSKMAVRKLTALAIACGITSLDALKKAKAENKGVDLQFPLCQDKYVCLVLEDNTYNNRTTTQLSWDSIYHPADKRANHIPLIAAHLKVAGITLPEGRNIGGNKAATATPTKPAAPAVSEAAAANAGNLLAGVQL